MIVCAGLCLMAYPWISNWLYERSVDSTVDAYAEKATEMDREDMEQMWKQAGRYNERLAASDVVLTDPFDFTEEDGTDITYESVLSVDGSGYMCSVEIPEIHVSLPVYHGTSETVLKKGAGHLEGSSFPVGGRSTHAVISAHTGLSTAKMFTDLTELKEGDVFFLHVLDQTLTYKVCDVQVVLPQEVEYLAVQKDRDLVTLLTCTPYGVNTHRLLVTGERTEIQYTETTEETKDGAGSSSQWMHSYRLAVFAGLFLVLAAVLAVKLYLFLTDVKRNRSQRRAEKKNRKQVEKVKVTIGMMLLLGGIGLCLYPTVRTWMLNRQTETIIREFEERTEIQYAETEGEETTESTDKEDDLYYQECRKYNETIYREGQEGLTDAWSYEQPAVSPDEMEGEIFGYVEIPAMEAKLALYLGASEENLEKGVAVMGQTSLPIGGEDTNCVIAGHRGYYGSPYFREIENLSVGDFVYITNPWETLAYRVASIDIIEPYDIDAIKIQEGRDMVTLLTCHPYAANTVEKVRYVVYCERDYDAEIRNSAFQNGINRMDGTDSSGKACSAERNGNMEKGHGKTLVASSGQKYESSKEDIRMENVLRYTAAALLMLMAAAVSIKLWKEKKSG